MINRTKTVYKITKETGARCNRGQPARDNDNDDDDDDEDDDDDDDDEDDDDDDDNDDDLLALLAAFSQCQGGNTYVTVSNLPALRQPHSVFGAFCACWHDLARASVIFW